MSPLIIMAVIGVAEGLVVGLLTKIFKNATVSFGSGYTVGIMASGVAKGLSTEHLSHLLLHSEDVLIALVTCALFMYFSDDDRRKRFRKKTSEALKKLIAKVKELAPTPAPKPLPA